MIGSELMPASSLLFIVLGVLFFFFFREIVNSHWEIWSTNARKNVVNIRCQLGLECVFYLLHLSKTCWFCHGQKSLADMEEDFFGFYTLWKMFYDVLNSIFVLYLVWKKMTLTFLFCLKKWTFGQKRWQLQLVFLSRGAKCWSFWKVLAKLQLKYF